MLGSIENIEKDLVYVKLGIDLKQAANIINMYVLFQDNNGTFVGEITEIKKDIAQIKLLGEYKNNDFIFGVLKKPSFASKISLLAPNYISKIIGNETDSNNTLKIGLSPFYDNVYINANLSNFFGNHTAIFGNTGSGKSCGFSRIIQNLVNKGNISPNMNLIIFDAYGEYHNAFSYLNNTPNMGFKAYSTSNGDNILSIPPWFLNVDDYAILLNITKKEQLPIIDKTLRNIDLFVRQGENANRYKNSIIASALLDILVSGKPASQIRDQIIGSLTKFNTPELNLESTVSQPGYTRTLRQCLLVDENNKINAMELIISFLQGYLTDSVPTEIPDGSYPYTLEDFSMALDFALIDEGIWKSEKIFDDANIIKVRLNTLINSDNKRLFEYPEYIDKQNYIYRLFTTPEGKKCQLLNFNISSVDDRMAKSLVKIYSKLFFEYAKNLPVKASQPFNIFLEEAHRYVQKDTDIDVLGYNIFERICKEGRKYGVLLGLISQRPCEISETCLSQCSNFVLFKITHPLDVAFVEKIIPAITDDIIERMKSVTPGNCIVFGSAFKVPALVRMEMPNPEPSSQSTNITSLWFQ